MISHKDYYAILDLQKGANHDQIKRSFRKLAIKWHPDKNLENKQIATQRFKEISEAYEILSDQNKRVDYDRYGYVKNNSGFTSAEDIFKTFFSNFGFDARDDQQYFGTKYGSHVFFKKKPQYYTDSPTFVGTNYNNIFKNYFNTPGSGVSTSGAYSANSMFGGMSSVGGRTYTDIPSSNMFSASNSTLGGYPSADNKYYHNYSSGYCPYGSGSKYQQPSCYSVNNASSGGTVSKEVQKTTSQVNGKKVVTTKTIIYHKDGSKTITQVSETEGEEKTQKTYKVPA